MDLALIGLPQSGKSSLFSALSAGHSGRAAAGKENISVVKLPDDRLERLSAFAGARKITAAEARLHDPPLTYGSGGALAGDLSTLSEADALLHVVRAFRRHDIPHLRGEVNPKRDIVDLDTELLFRDLAIVERRLDRLSESVRFARASERDDVKREQSLLTLLKERLENEMPLHSCPLSNEEKRQVSNYGLLTLKPIISVINIDESDTGKVSETEAAYRSLNKDKESDVVAISARLESELGEMPDREAAEFRRDLDLESSAGDRVFDIARKALSLVTFYTVGEDTRSWHLRGGSSAIQAAGKIHSDIERGFIRAEVIGWSELLEAGSTNEARKRALLRSEGKEYIIQDGDVINILFKV